MAWGKHGGSSIMNMRRKPYYPSLGSYPGFRSANRPLAQSYVMPPSAKRSMIGGTTAALGKRSWDKDLLGEVLGDIIGNVDTAPLPGQWVGETGIGDISKLDQAGQAVGDISKSPEWFWGDYWKRQKALGYA